MEFEKLQGIIAEVMNVSEDDITTSTTFVDDLGADSLDIFEIVAVRYRDPPGRSREDRNRRRCR